MLTATPLSHSSRHLRQQLPTRHRFRSLPSATAGEAALPRVLTIALTGVSNRTVPTPAFTFTPTTPEKNASVRFDASTTTDESVVCLDVCSYAWGFGDGSTGTGRITSHAFTSPGTYTVTLTVTDDAGTSASTASTVTVSDVPAPTVTLSVSPTPPLLDKPAVFAAVVTAVPNHSIQRYEWNFDDGTTQVTVFPTVSHTYSAVGTYVVTVTAIDDLDQAGIAALTVTVANSVAAPVASFTVSPNSPAKTQTVTFDGSTSTVGVGATITKYVWTSGDGSSPTDTGTTTSHTVTYALAGTYTASLTITDSFGRTNTATVTVTVVE